MDDVMRPQAAAARRARLEIIRRVEATTPAPKKPLVSKEAVSSHDAQHSGFNCSPCRPITRAKEQGEKRANYDMSYHPIDGMLQPLRLRRSSTSKSLEVTLPTPPLVDSNPLTNPLKDDWNKLSPLDHRLYKLQKGTPLNGHTLPLDWPCVVEILVEGSFFTLDELQSWGGCQALIARYEAVRLKIESSFGAKAEPESKLDWTILYAEHFDVYSYKPDTKYWRRHGDAVVRPKSIRNHQSQIKLGKTITDSPERFERRMNPDPAGTELEENDSGSVSGFGSSFGSPVSYNDAQGYLEQTYGRFDSSASASASGSASPEDDIVSEMRNELCHSVTDVMGDSELDIAFSMEPSNGKALDDFRPGPSRPRPSRDGKLDENYR
ncbi:MAG: hypothetical protein Q9190_007696 [Brigantiaea leucoxantha]